MELADVNTMIAKLFECKLSINTMTIMAYAVSQANQNGRQKVMRENQLDLDHYPSWWILEFYSILKILDETKEVQKTHA